MKLKYIGDGNDAPKEIFPFGIRFVLGEVVQVVDECAQSKLKNNPCFEVVSTDDIEDAQFEEIKPKRRGRPKRVENGNNSGSEEEGGNQVRIQPEQHSVISDQ